MRDRITVRMTDKMIAQIDTWIAEQAGNVSRQEAVRRLVEFSLEHAANSKIRVAQVGSQIQGSNPTLDDDHSDAVG